MLTNRKMHFPVRARERVRQIGRQSTIGNYVQGNIRNLQQQQQCLLVSIAFLVFQLFRFFLLVEDIRHTIIFDVFCRSHLNRKFGEVVTDNPHILIQVGSVLVIFPTPVRTRYQILYYKSYVVTKLLKIRGWVL